MATTQNQPGPFPPIPDRFPDSPHPLTGMLQPPTSFNEREERQRIAEDSIRRTRLEWEEQQRKRQQKQSDLHVEQSKPVVSNAQDPWKHRSTGMQCRSCMWFAEKSGRALGLGRCRRHAPSMNGYPVVFEADWCGDHKLDENKV